MHKIRNNNFSNINDKYNLSLDEVARIPYLSKVHRSDNLVNISFVVDYMVTIYRYQYM